MANRTGSPVHFRPKMHVETFPAFIFQSKHAQSSLSPKMGWNIPDLNFWTSRQFLPAWSKGNIINALPMVSFLRFVKNWFIRNKLRMVVLLLMTQAKTPTSLEPWCLEPWNRGNWEPHSPGILELWDHGTLEICNLAILETCNCGILEPCKTSEPCLITLQL